MRFCLPFGHSVPQKEAKDVMIISFFPLHTTIAPAAAALPLLPRASEARRRSSEREGQQLRRLHLSPSVAVLFTALLPLFLLPLDLLGHLLLRSGTRFPDHNDDDCRYDDDCHHHWQLSPSMTIVTINDNCHYQWRVSLPMSVTTDECHYRWVSLPMRVITDDECHYRWRVSFIHISIWIYRFPLPYPFLTTGNTSNITLHINRATAHCCLVFIPNNS